MIMTNVGDGTFRDVTWEARVGPSRRGSGAVWADFDADGDLDLYVTSLGDTRHYLYINQVYIVRINHMSDQIQIPVHFGACTCKRAVDLLVT